jgi:hypothetical protein
MIKISTPQEEGPYRVSKWIKHAVLLSDVEMEDLFSALPPFEIFIVSDIVTAETMRIVKEEWLGVYKKYFETIRQGEIPEEERKAFSAVLSTTPDALYAMPVKEGRYLIKIVKPVIQLRMHKFIFSTLEKKVYSMAFGKESISWGIEFSYAHLFQCPKTHEFFNVGSDPQFPNTPLYRELARWMRKNSVPAFFDFEGREIASSIRAGVRLGEIDHAQLNGAGLKMRTRYEM